MSDRPIIRLYITGQAVYYDVALRCVHATIDVVEKQ
jgi:hypothetical protein